MQFPAENLNIRIEGLRQPVTDTLLSYSGTRANLALANATTNNAFGNKRTWGGVTKNGARASAYYDDGYFGAFGVAGGSVLVGTNVAENGLFEALIGAYFRPYKTDTDRLSLGINIAYMGYDKNLSNFSFGQGGYFQPAQLRSADIPARV